MKLVMISLKLLIVEYLENTLHYTSSPPPLKIREICKDPGFNLLENPFIGRLNQAIF